MSDGIERGVDPAEQAATEHPVSGATPLRHLIHAFAADPAAARRHIRTGFADLDGLCGGLFSGVLWVITGRSGAGKSVLVTDLIRASAVRHGQPALLITRSASAQVVQRLLAAEGKLPLHHMKSGLSEDEEVRLRKTMEKLVNVPLAVAQAEVLDLPVITAHVAAQQGENPLRLLLIDDLPVGPDQLQLLTELRELAVEHQVSVVVVAQEDVDDAERQLRRIEQVADVALTVHREDQTDFDSPRAGEADFIISRHRNGPIATIAVHFQGHYGRFVDPPSGWHLRSAKEAQRRSTVTP